MPVCGSDRQLQGREIRIADVASGSKAPARNQSEQSPESTYDETHCWLAQALFALGDGRRAQQHLELARQHSPTLREQALYAAKLDRLSAQNLQ